MTQLTRSEATPHRVKLTRCVRVWGANPNKLFFIFPATENMKNSKWQATCPACGFYAERNNVVNHDALRTVKVKQYQAKTVLCGLDKKAV